jgi:hypothetical protein
MRLKIANAVEGSRYNFLKVTPGSFSRYSKEARLETAEAILATVRARCDSRGGEDVSSKLGLEVVAVFVNR